MTINLVPELGLFRDRTLILATKHRKEQAIAPLLEPALGVKVVVPTDFDTDRFGTFTREIQRPADQHGTGRLKAAAALEMTGESLAIASEGSFGPHPAFPFLPCNRELVILIDRHHDLEVVGEALSTETNYRQQAIASLGDAEKFAAEVGFPDHGLVVQSGDLVPVTIAKGITSLEALHRAVSEGLAQHGTIQLGTDMRALYNPTRMAVIAQATQDLLQKLRQTCPSCGTPGFDVVERMAGLPCAWCQMPTALVRSHRYQCKKCGFQQEALYPNGHQTADPSQCAHCNP